MLKRDLASLQMHRDFQAEGEKERILQNLNVPMEFLNKAGLNQEEREPLPNQYYPNEAPPVYYVEQHQVYGTHPYQGVQAQPIDEELDKTLRVL